MNEKLKEIDIKIRKLQDEYNQAGAEMEKAKKKFASIGKLLIKAEAEEKKLKELKNKEITI